MLYLHWCICNMGAISSTKGLLFEIKYSAHLALITDPCKNGFDGFDCK